MMNKMIKGIILGCLVITMSFSAFAQRSDKYPKEKAVPKECCQQKLGCEAKDECCESKMSHANEAYDPLIPQLFVFDKANNTFGAINEIDNTIDIIHRKDNEFVIVKKVLVDVFEGRHDEHHIYRPQSVAIYENHLVFLASHRDSCYLSVLNLQGDEVKKMFFKGRAFAFSYNASAKELYIAGQNDLGYDIVALSTEKGIQNISLEESPALHYQKPRKAAQILIADPIGIGMAAVAMSVVFMALLLLTAIFASTGKILTAFQNFRASLFAKKQPKTVAGTTATVKPSTVSGEEYAAIAAAIFMYNNELHDEENTILTIERTTRTWTPWNARYFGMNTYFRKK